jgi:tetratricopeptide (TPR) repeat protein
MHILGRCLHNHAALLAGQLKQPEKAEEIYRRSLRTHRELVQDYPLILRFRNELARHHLYLAELLVRDPGRAEEAEAEFAQARSLFANLARDGPTTASHHGNLGITLCDLADLSRRRGDLAVVCRLWDEAAAALEKAAKINPRHRPYAERLYRLYGDLAAARRERGEYELADQAATCRAAWERELSKPPSR